MENSTSDFEQNVPSFLNKTLFKETVLREPQQRAISPIAVRKVLHGLTAMVRLKPSQLLVEAPVAFPSASATAKEIQSSPFT